MHPQLEILLQIQDLKGQHRELTEAGAGRDVEEQEFKIDPEKAVRDLEGKIAEMEAELSPAIRGKYERISAGRGKAVVPVINGICYGCFVSIPTLVTSQSIGGSDIQTCENCGRFLYIMS